MKIKSENSITDEDDKSVDKEIGMQEKEEIGEGDDEDRGSDKFDPKIINDIESKKSEDY